LDTDLLRALYVLIFGDIWSCFLIKNIWFEAFESANTYMEIVVILFSEANSKFLKLTPNHWGKFTAKTMRKRKKMQLIKAFNNISLSWK